MKFHELRPGQFFKYQDKKYLKTEPRKGGNEFDCANCLCLDDNTIDYLHYGDSVSVICGEINIGETNCKEDN